jgi:hypothetical protein
LKCLRCIKVTSNENGLEVKAEKNKYIIISQDQNPKQSSNTQIGDKLFETVGQLKALGKTFIHQ